MITYLKYNQCLVCNKSVELDSIQVKELGTSLPFHPECFFEASGEKFVNGRIFSKEEWLDFAGGDYCLAEKHCVEQTNGTKHWWLNNRLHREDGPAIEYADGSKHWWRNNKRHRKDGPAVENINGAKEWWLNGELLTKQKFNEKLNIP